jgi:hypothetical protein
MGAIENEGADTIETTIVQEKQVAKVEEITERIEQKIIQAESIGEVEGLVAKIFKSMAELTEGETVVTKGLAMFTNLGVHKFDDLKKKSVDELKANLLTVDELLKEKRLRVKESTRKVTEKPSFNLENP